MSSWMPNIAGIARKIVRRWDARTAPKNVDQAPAGGCGIMHHECCGQRPALPVQNRPDSVHVLPSTREDSGAAEGGLNVQPRA
eukprot:CAMPEP_0181233772 /NCGR_PEP_ID=MMETSP1096-20121128/36551_1 /TAXON_ID=156174 ORGANISM="Chrysochromulina ericina, Strain CCMP281" /NCGR_SAMPLE_ID=MMETSP1096 /ASSEMBLY_ACC=CAM_ASM_000453 /LENGTH=82 /DNA_ID=CAMNT_0023328369 /DNA_START=130 /DNA_END=379 /DNA_ORIENTATION=+